MDAPDSVVEGEVTTVVGGEVTTVVGGEVTTVVEGEVTTVVGGEVTTVVAVLVVISSQVSNAKLSPQSSLIDVPLGSLKQGEFSISHFRQAIKCELQCLANLAIYVCMN